MLTKQEDKNQPSIQMQLDRLLLCNQIRELADYKYPITISDLSRFGSRFVIWIAKHAYRLSRSAPSRPENSRKKSIAKAILVDGLTTFFLQIVLECMHRRANVKSIARALRSSSRRILFYEGAAFAANGYALSTEKEEILIKVFLLLRLKRWYGAATELLIGRLNSKLPSSQTKRWLKFLFREVEDAQAADGILNNAADLPVAEGIRRHHAADSSRGILKTLKLSDLKFGIVVATIFDSEIFRSSLSSLLKSDVNAEIVVVEEGSQPEHACEQFCRSLSLKYIKNKKFGGVSSCFNLGIEALDSATDVIILAHNDILWPSQWFGAFRDAWRKVWDSGKVGLINLGYLQFDVNSDSALKQLFVEGKHEELRSILMAIRESFDTMNYVQDVQSKDLGKLFGLARDPWNENMARLQMMSGRFSVAASLPKRLWKEIGGFTADIYAGDLEVQYHCLQHKKFMLWINNVPLIHYRSHDTLALKGDQQEKFFKMTRVAYDHLFAKFGWEVDDFLSTYFSEIAIIYHDEIVEAANQLRFSDCDFIFDEFFKRLKMKWKPSREVSRQSIEK